MNWRLLMCCALCSNFLVVLYVYAQGGPPLLTDDSDTPGDGNWEINVATTFEGARSDYLLAFPYFDINYGLGDRIQLKVEMPWVKEPGEPLANKFDNITFGVKYMALDEDSDGVFLSFYPQPIISFNPEDSGKKRAYGIILPIAASKQILKTGVNFQGGYQILGSQQEWFYGVVVDHAVNKYLLAMAEIHGIIARKSIVNPGGDDEIFFRAGTFLNFGLEIKPAKEYFINLAFGKDLDAHPIFTSQARYYGYVGIQINLQRSREKGNPDLVPEK